MTEEAYRVQINCLADSDMATTIFVPKNDLNTISLN